MQLAIQNKKKRITVANIQFAIGNKNKDPSGKPLSFKNDAIREELAIKIQPRQTGITRNSFIPRTGIKSQCQFDKNKKLQMKPLHPASLSYSKFPIRKPLSAKSTRSFIPVYRQRIFSFCNQQELEFDVSNHLYTAGDKMRLTTSSLITLKQKGAEGKAIQRNAKSSKGERMPQSFLNKLNRYQIAEKIYF